MKRYTWVLHADCQSKPVDNEVGEWVKYEDIKDYLCYTCLSVLNEKKMSSEEIIRKELNELKDLLLTAIIIPH